eukprot:NODE_5966_length_944_cov_73.742996_g5378_i0.p1 GENE.NODE_5966_length_944_cov_73.742996_g5378_i0~~NODE_5966_length_944_cov_73.742996_g5378_i0.p1  ORF type:complete len:271 (-),score=38.75 NODE_5966_length_944_cov_73.742996_g5378_i0:76-888(-)
MSQYEPAQEGPDYLLQAKTIIENAIGKPLTAQEQEIILYVVPIVLIVIVLLSLLCCCFRKRQRGNRILFIGLPNAGKTAFWYKVTLGQDASTHSSMQPNEGFLDPASAPPKMRSKRFPVIDLPGHPRLKYLINENLPLARGIVFFIDSLEFGETITPCAELLFTLLTNHTVVSRPIPILIACNKRDSEMSFKATAIKSKLEKEINLLRTSRKNELGSIGDGDDEGLQGVPLGVDSVPFTFDSDAPVPLHWAECSVRKGNTKSVTDWIWHQ